MKKKINIPSITFVFILYNSASLIERSITMLLKAIEFANWSNADIIVVNDGSTDNTVDIVKKIAKKSKTSIKIINQRNQGRLAASIKGTKEAKGDLVSFMGARVFMDKKSLAYLKNQLENHPDRRVWNCHINVPRKGNLQARFWHVITFITWRRYLGNPRYMSYDISDFDYFPKGTGAFICSKKLLLEGYKHINSIYSNNKYSSDDTTLIRYIATKERIHMSPDYSADYIARSNTKDFIKHTYDRGVFLLDSYMRPGTRLFIPIILYFVMFIPAILLVIFYPLILAVIPVILILILAGLLLSGVKFRDSISFVLVLPFFGIVYSLGLWKGLIIYLRGLK